MPALMEELKGKRIKLCASDAIEPDATVILSDFTDQHSPPPPPEPKHRGARGGGGGGFRGSGGGGGASRRDGGGSGRYDRRDRDRNLRTRRLRTHASFTVVPPPAQLPV